MSISVCRDCTYYRMRQPLRLFGENDLGNAGILKAQMEWDQQLRQRALQEQQRVAAGQSFDYEPFSYAWCAAYTVLGESELLEDSSISDGPARPFDLDYARALKADREAFERLASAGHAVMNPVTGDVSRTFALCVQLNPTGQCSEFKVQDETAR